MHKRTNTNRNLADSGAIARNGQALRFYIRELTERVLGSQRAHLRVIWPLLLLY